MRSASPDRDRWLALGILLAVLAVAYLVCVHPWWTVPMQQLGQRIDDLQQRDLRARMLLSQAPALQAQAAELQQSLADQPGFLPERTPELATAALVQRLEAVVAQASPGNRSCAIINRSPMTVPAQQSFPRAQVQVRLRCGGPELAAALHALESGSPRVFVDNLNILSQRHFASSDTQGRGVGLDVSFDLYGYLRPVAGGADAH